MMLLLMPVFALEKALVSEWRLRADAHLVSARCVLAKYNERHTPC
ncbi:hypothetical protein MCEGE14_02776 [Burkholderiaceae bacterium]